MLQIFHLGPVLVSRHRSWLVTALDASGNLLAPALEKDLARALSVFVGEHRDVPLRCEPSLARLARGFEIDAAPLSDDARMAKGILAWGLSYDSPIADRSGVEAFLRACAEFWATRPWEQFGSEDVFPVATEVGRSRTIGEATVLGAGGQEFGLALYDRPGSVDRMVAGIDSGRMAETLKIDSLAVTMDDEPEWVAAALSDAIGLPRVPVLMRLKGGRVGRPSPLELAQLTAVLEGFSLLAGGARPDDALSSHTEVRTEAGTVKATVSLPDAAELADPVVPVPPSPSSRATVLRNERCPCGSGKKYKSCHLGEDTARAATETRRLAERDAIHALDERLVADVLAHARARWGAEFQPLAALRALHIDPAVIPALDGWAAAHCPGRGGETALELFLAERGHALDPSTRALAEARSGAWFSYLEVVSVEPGVSLVLRDLLSGRERTVQEVSASRILVARDVVCATVLDLGDRCILGGCHLSPLPPMEADHARRDLRHVLGARGARVSMARLREATSLGLPLGVWQAHVTARDRRPPPELHNTDGEPLLVTTDLFDVAPDRAAAVVEALCTLPGAERDDDETRRGTVVTFTRENGPRDPLPSTVVGRAILRGSALRLESNSVARADTLRSRVSELLGDRIRFKGRSHADPLAGIDRMPSQDGGSTSQPPVPAELAEALRRTEAELARRWLDLPVPALGGLTPREAARRKGAVRKTLEVLLAERENFEARRPSAERFDVVTLRSELGLD